MRKRVPAYRLSFSARRLICHDPRPLRVLSASVGLQRATLAHIKDGASFGRDRRIKIDALLKALGLDPAVEVRVIR